MRRVVFLAFALLLPSSALAAPTPWFDQAWAEELVSLEFPAYWEWMQQVRASDQDRYLDLLHQARGMALNSSAWPELREAWENRWHALREYQRLVGRWREEPASRGDAARQAIGAAAEDLHLANLELFDVRLAIHQAHAARLELQIEDHEQNYDVFALETVERAIGAE